MIFRIAFLYLKNEADALDVVQNIKLLKKNNFNNDEHLKRWLLRVCINLCINNLKSYWKRNVYSFEEEYYIQDNADLQLQQDIKKELVNYKIKMAIEYNNGIIKKKITFKEVIYDEKNSNIYMEID